MKPQTQSITWTPERPFGNCWQTAVACVLGIDAAELPDQVLIESRYAEAQKLAHGATEFFSFHNALQHYLGKHHGLAFTDVYAWLVPAVRIEAGQFDGFHIVSGETVRTPTNGTKHSVVGRRGEVVWDPHPSRAGLTKIEHFGVLVPRPDEWGAWNRRGDEKCWCPACGGTPELVAKDAA